jgi:hypothetical protein
MTKSGKFVVPTDGVLARRVDEAVDDVLRLRAPPVPARLCVVLSREEERVIIRGRPLNVLVEERPQGRVVDDHAKSQLHRVGLRQEVRNWFGERDGRGLHLVRALVVILGGLVISDEHIHWAPAFLFGTDGRIRLLITHTRKRQRERERRTRGHT